MSFPLRPLRDLSTVVRRGISPKYSDTGILVINQKCIRDYRVETSMARRHDAVARAVPLDRQLLIHDVLVNSTGVGTLGRVAGVRAVPAEPTTHDSHVTLVRPDLVQVDGKFFRFAVEARQQQIQDMGTGATGQTELSRDRLADEILIPTPPLAKQRTSGAVLGALDDLIENNRRRVEVLEEMARAIYREWFVKFRYPGHSDVPMVDSPLGPIPESWEFSTLAAVADITMGQSPKSEFYNRDGLGKPFHQGVTDFGPHFPRTRKWCSVEGRSAFEGDVLISVRAPVGRINVADTGLVIGRGLSAIRAKDGRQGLLLGCLRDAFSEEDSMGNDGAIFKSLGKAELAAVQVIVASEEVADAADKILSDNLAMIRALSLSVQRLTALRDVLLPRLVAGQIDVSTLDLDALLEEAVA